MASVCFHLHWLKGKDSLEVWHTTVTLRWITHVGFVSGVAGTTALIWYLFLTFYHNICKCYANQSKCGKLWSLENLWFFLLASPPVAENTLISAVWSFFCGKWGFLLMYYGNHYEITIREGPSSGILSQDSA